MNITTYLHLPGITDAQRTPAFYRELFAEAVTGGLKPLAIPTVGTIRMGLHLSAHLTALAEGAARQHKSTEGSIFGSMASAAWAFRRSPNEKKNGANHVPGESASDRERKKNQKLMVGYGMEAAGSKALNKEGHLPLVFVEGATGTGKSRVICETASAILHMPGIKLVGIGAPTVSTLGHLLAEWGKVSACRDVPKRIVLGRGQFVDEQALADLLVICATEKLIPAAEIAAVDAWLLADCPPVTANSGFLATASEGLAYLLEDLKALAPSIETQCVTLTHQAVGKAAKIYSDLRANAQDFKGVLFFTHAMLCADVDLRGYHGGNGVLLPDCDFLLIDEAHMLEETMANQVCGNLHLSMLRKSMRNGAMWTPLRMKKQSQIVLSLTEDAITILREIPNNETLRNSDRADEKWEQLTRLAPLLEALKAFHTKALENKDHKELKRVDDWYEILSKALSGKHTVRVTHSPVRSMPGITVGPTSVGRWLRELWSRIRGGAFYSGTLYTQKASNNEYSAAYAAYKLHVPPDRVLERLPIHPSWVYSLPTVFTPSKAMAGRLSYMRPDPKPSDREAVAAFIEYRKSMRRYAGWVKNVAEQIENVGKTATGGTLVLCNSFEDIARFTKRLRTKLKRRLIVQVRDGASVPTIKAEFIAKAKAGQRPIWLGTGAAWTGLDLTDSTIAAAEDMILTDLIITRIPFGQNHTSTHLAKLERDFYPEVVEAGFKLRQGCGRLIRREGVVNRRIWFLDGRIHQGRHFMEAARFFQRYTRRMEITG